MLPIAINSIWSPSEIPLLISNNPQNYVSQVKPLAESYLAHSQDLKHGRNTQSFLLHRGRVTNCTVVLCNHTTVFFNDGFQNRNDGPGWGTQPKMHETCTYHNSLYHRKKSISVRSLLVYSIIWSHYSLVIGRLGFI